MESSEPVVPPAAPPAGQPAYQSGPLARGGTPGALVAAGVILLVLAVLALLWTVLFFAYAALAGSITSAIQNNPGSFGSFQFSGVVEAMRPVIYAFAFVTFCLAAAHFAAGIGVLGRRGWGRITGLVLSVLGLVVNVIGLISMLAGIGSARQVVKNGVLVDPMPGIVLGVVIFVSFGAAYFFVLIVLARRGRDFA